MFKGEKNLFRLPHQCAGVIGDDLICLNVSVFDITVNFERKGDVICIENTRMDV